MRIIYAVTPIAWIILPLARYISTCNWHSTLNKTCIICVFNFLIQFASTDWHIVCIGWHHSHWFVYIDQNCRSRLMLTWLYSRLPEHSVWIWCPSTAFILLYELIMVCLWPDCGGWELIDFYGAGIFVCPLEYKSTKRLRKPADRIMCFLLKLTGLVQTLNTNCVVIYHYLLFLYFLYNLNVICTAYSSRTSWCVLSETFSVAVNDHLKNVVCIVLVFTLPFSPLHYWISNCYHDSMGTQLSVISS